MKISVVKSLLNEGFWRSYDECDNKIINQTQTHIRAQVVNQVNPNIGRLRRVVFHLVLTRIQKRRY